MTPKAPPAGHFDRGHRASGRLKEIIGVTKVGTAIQLHADVLERLDAAAARLGRSRDELIEDSVRRDLAGQLLTAIFAAADAADTADLDVTALVGGSWTPRW
jgi:predicted transcriptional regulator